MDHTTLLGLLLAADPSQAACSFRTVFAEGETGETGTLRYLATDRWILDVDQGGRTVSTPDGSRCTGPDGNVRLHPHDAHPRMDRGTPRSPDRTE
ncbi:hypothetical protein ACWGHM_00290 [Streptomyces sp. NPDC054904]|uniref:hypothetical protein n=1 Tax=Streptomyces sp. NPDC090054 TaxID=3365933 RepID=UPI00380A3CAF